MLPATIPGTGKMARGGWTDLDTNNVITFAGPTSPTSIGSAPFGHNVFLGLNSPIPQFRLATRAGNRL